MGTDEWVAELYKEFPKFYMERSKRYGNNYTVTVISHFGSEPGHYIHSKGRF